MSNRFFRFGTWLAVLGMVMTNFGPLTSHAAASANYSPNLHTLVADQVVINEFMSQPQGQAKQFVELYNPAASAIDLTGWALGTASHGIVYTFPAQAWLGPAGYAELTFSDQLGSVNDTLSLYNNFGAQIDQIRYGQGAAAQVAAPGQGKSDGRLADGGDAWYVNLTASPDASNATANQTAALPTQPASVWVKPGSGNRAHIINRSNMAATYLAIVTGADSDTTQSVTGELLDRLGVLKAASADSPQGQALVTVGAIDTTATPALTDGPVTVRAIAYSKDGLASAYTYGPLVGRDTSAPAAPLAAQVIGTAGVNADNVINSNSVSGVRVQVTLPATSTNTDILRVHLSDGTNVVSLDTPIIQGGGLMTVSLNASGLNDGMTEIQAWLLDSAGNPSPVLSGTTATKDTQAPDGTVVIDGGATVTTTTSVSLSLSASDVGTGVSQMRIANTNNFAGTSFEPFTQTKTWQLIPGSGLRTVYVQFEDKAGNISAARNVLSTNEALIDVQPSVESVSLVSLAVGTQTVRQLPTEAIVTATSPTNLTFGTFTTDPAGALPTGLTQVGQYVEVGTSDSSKITFPVVVKIYYSQDDLSKAGVTNASQLRGIGFANEETGAWQLYANTGVSNAPVNVDGHSYSGYVYAIADHLTPMTALADTTPPVTPSSVVVQAGPGQAAISWSPVADAANYVVRYRHDNGSYATVVVGSTTTQVTITNLVNGARYDVQVASRDAAGNMSDFAGTTVTPNQPAPVAATTPSPTPKVTTKVTPKPSASPSPSPKTSTPSPTPSPTTSANSSSNQSASNYLVILAILIIAIGAGTAGWYGYQWWVMRPAAKPPTPPAPPAAGQPTPPSTPKAPPSSPASPPPAATPPTSGAPADKPTPPKEGRW